MATFWERAAHSFNHMFCLLCPFVVLIVFQNRNPGNRFFFHDETHLDLDGRNGFSIRI